MSESSLAVILNSNAFASRSLISHRKGCERLGLLQVVNSAGVEPTISRFEGEQHPRDLPAVHKWALAVVIVSRICSTFRITNLNLTHPWLASFSCDSVIHFIFYIFFSSETSSTILLARFLLSSSSSWIVIVTTSPSFRRSSVTPSIEYLVVLSLPPPVASSSLIRFIVLLPSPHSVTNLVSQEG